MATNNLKRMVKFQHYTVILKKKNIFKEKDYKHQSHSTKLENANQFAKLIFLMHMHRLTCLSFIIRCFQEIPETILDFFLFRFKIKIKCSSIGYSKTIANSRTNFNCIHWFHHRKQPTRHPRFL